MAAPASADRLALPTGLHPGGIPDVGADSGVGGGAWKGRAGAKMSGDRSSVWASWPRRLASSFHRQQDKDGSSWWKIHLFRGMANDVRRRAPYYVSDWLDAWDYRVVPATVYMYFANILPALAFSLDMFTKTGKHYGVNEVLLASVLGAVVFSVLACQPLVIVGVTGPITVFNYTVYDIVHPRGTNYLAFMCWVGLWSLVLHWILAATNACNGLRYVTRFPCDIFGFYVAFIYLQKGIQVLSRLGSEEPFYLSIFIGLAVFVVAYLCGEMGRGSLLTHKIRVFLKDYGTPLTVVFFSGFVHIGRMRSVSLEVLPTGIAFEPTAIGRSWLVNFWHLSVGDVFLALPFAVLLTVLFYFDHNVSSLIAQGTEFPLKKPAGFHWDLFLLGLTTGVAGLLGLPFPNGLIPQAPFHTESLCRVSNLAQGLLTAGTMTGPLLVVLHLIPQAVLAGLFFVMGVQALEGNGITAKLLFLVRDASLTPRSHPLRQLSRRAAVWAFVAIELVGFGATFAITQTIAAVGFPVIILLLIPVRACLLPHVFTAEELTVLDGPTASPFTMESVCGTLATRDGGADSSDSSDSSDSPAREDGVLVGNPTSGEATAMASIAPSVGRSDEDLAELGENKNVANIEMQALPRMGIHNRRGQTGGGSSSTPKV
ncbi:anion exchange family protein [Grosmannia clavigera kw1407]|uniref:Anion exchange family protein n=1 Tax=Grosmannia clavigera (strain kw1407 / UAMH 11150) TaxID=655863 RepID=F0XEA6_GROCL|nr:anion exchange family protein [Grosmannia clavigera kw1407]EFX04482.1 anion exchange family protein [Grosmannia clavigera kw1407]